MGVLLFGAIWGFVGLSRHHGVLFLGLVAAVWFARGTAPRATRMSWLFVVLLTVNAFAGVLTLTSELRPFSNSRETAAWIKANGLAGSFLIGSSDAPVSAVAGYLGRPFYSLECECFSTFIVWNRQRKVPLPRDDFAGRLSKAVDLGGFHDAILIRNRPVAADDVAPGLSAELLQTFDGAYVNENFWVYRVRRN